MFERISFYISKKIMPNFVIGFAILLALGSSAYGVTKLIDAIPSISDAIEENSQNSNESQILFADSDAEDVLGSNSSNSDLVGNQNNTGLCLVVISGQAYNVTNLRNTHTGGDIFLCGTDMTAKYQDIHSTNMSRMFAYIYKGTQSIASTGGNTGSTGGTGTTSGSTSGTGIGTGSTIGTGTTSNGLCLVTISGQAYEVTNLRKTHTGGDIFVCGSDMTKAYNSKHGTNMTRMNSYKYTGTQTVGRTAGAPAPTPTSTPANTEVFNSVSLATHNVSGNCYVAIGGKVYNVNSLSQWANCSHHGSKGGKDLTSKFPHSSSYLAGLPIMGTYVNTGTTTSPAPSTFPSPSPSPSTSPSPSPKPRKKND